MTGESWWLEGDLLDACNCELLCPCHISFRQKPTYDTCEAIWGVHIEGGSMGETDLAGLNALIIAFCPGPTMYDGHWTGLIYLDSRVTPPQEAALTAIFSGDAGGPWSRLAPFFEEGKIKTVKRASLDFVKEGRNRRMIASGLASLELEAIRGVDPDEEVKLTNLRNVIHGNEHILARSTHNVHDQGVQWDNAGKNGLYSTFRWSGP